MTARPLALILVALALAACGKPPVHVFHSSARDVHRTLTESALSASRPSAWSATVLHRLHLQEVYRKEPAVALAELHGRLGHEYDDDLLFALAELSFLHAERSGATPHFLASTAYAYAFLFPPDRPQGLDPLDPRVRLSADLYNRALTEALKAAGEEEVELSPRRLPLPFGSLDVAFDEAILTWAGHPLIEIVPAAEFQVRGLRNRYRRAGIGAPFAASLGPHPDEDDARPETRRIPPRLKVPVTAVLRIDDPRTALRSGRLEGHLELYFVDRDEAVEIEGYARPIEAEPTAALAMSLERTRFWDLERSAFFSGLGAAGFDPGLLMLRPYQPGRVPVVLVHGTASSPGRWAELVNELQNDPLLGDRIQIWLFLYNSGSPVGYSAALLRASLEDAVAELDPAGTDPALREMVVIGHSQGGMLARLTATSSGDAFWRNLADEPLESLGLDPERERVLRDSLFFEPLPFVTRLVFISTPHRGSYLTVLHWGKLRPSNLIRNLIQTPAALVQASVDLASLDPGARLERRIDRIPTSIDNMTPGNPFLKTLSGLPISVPFHSIISVKGNGPPEEGSDGVVRYQSAHLDGAVSEAVVRSGHSTQGEPETIEEVRRILHAHLAELGPVSP